jgi:hypothetical protein
LLIKQYYYHPPFEIPSTVEANNSETSFQSNCNEAQRAIDRILLDIITVQPF